MKIAATTATTTFILPDENMVFVSQSVLDCAFADKANSVALTAAKKVIKLYFFIH